MADCPGTDRVFRGTKAQFRLGPFSPSTSFGSAFPVRLKNMDIGQKSQSSLSTANDLVSPNKATRTRTVREYEETITELKKENFDLKLRLYLVEVTGSRNSRKDEDGAILDTDSSVQVFVQLKHETESLRNELCSKESLLKDVVDREDRYLCEIEELKATISELQTQVQSLLELPSKEEYEDLLNVKNDLLMQIDNLEKMLVQKNDEIDLVNQKIDILGEQNEILMQKLHKRDMAIQSFVHKNYKEKELIPDEVRLPVIEAVKCAKSLKKKEFSIVINKIISVLNELASRTKEFPQTSEDKNVENISSAKNILEHVQEKSTYPSEYVSQQDNSESNILKNMCLEEQPISHFMNSVSLCEAKEKSPVSFWSASDPLQMVVNENAVDYSPSSVFHSPNMVLSEKLILNSNTEQRSLHSPPVLETCAYVCDVNSTHKYEQKATVLPVSLIKFDTPKENLVSCISTSVACTQTDFDGDVSEMKEKNLLQLDLEKKKKELADSQQNLYKVQGELEAALKKESNHTDKDLTGEKHELQVQPAHSCKVNVELFKYLKNLETFMEGLLQNSLNTSSIESFSEHSEFLSQVSKCLKQERFKLSHELSSQLSMLEDSKLYESSVSLLDRDEESSEYKRDSAVCFNESSHLLQDQGNGSNNPSDCASVCRNKGLIDTGSLLKIGLCSKCWHLATTFTNKNSNASQNNETCFQNVGDYFSSDSDIWSEPDRDVSLKRIGIDVSPVSSKSPRKSNRERRVRHEFNYDASSCEMTFSKRKRNARMPRRLFSQEMDSQLEKCCYVIAGKESKLRSVFQDFENTQDEALNIKDANLSREMSAVLSTISETLVKLKSAKDQLGTFGCGKCAVLELQTELLHFLNQEYFKIYNLPNNTKSLILNDFINELSFLQKECEAILPISSHFIKMSKSVECAEEQNDKIVSKGIAASTVPVVVDRNKSLEGDTSALALMKNENAKLAHQIVFLKKELLSIKEKEKRLILENERLDQHLSKSNSSNFELNSNLEILEEKLASSNQTLYQLSKELDDNKKELSELKEKCIKYESSMNKLINSKTKYQEKINILEINASNTERKYLDAVENFNSEKDELLSKLKVVENKTNNLEKENEFLNKLLSENSNELSLKTVKCEKLEAENAKLTCSCDELRQKVDDSDKKITELKFKCSKYEKDFEISSKELTNQLEGMKISQHEILQENGELLKEISQLISEKETVEKKLQEEKELTHLLAKEKEELINQLLQAQQQVNALHLANAQLKEAKTKLNQEYDLMKEDLTSSSSMCDVLTNDLSKLKDVLKNLESKCEMYEQDLCKLVNAKDVLISCLSNVEKELYMNISKLKDVCRVCGIKFVEKDVQQPNLDILSHSDNYKTLCQDIIIESSYLFELLSNIIASVKEFHLENQELKSLQEGYNLKALNVENQLELWKLESQHLKSDNEKLLMTIEEQKKIISNDKLSNETKYSEIQSLTNKLKFLENELNSYKIQLKLKEDEIAEQQKCLVSLQTSENRTLEQISSTDNVLPSKYTNNEDLNLSKKFAKFDDSITSNSSSRDSIEDISVLDMSPSKLDDKHEKCLKKLKSVHTKLAFSEKRIEILEYEKADLQENLLKKYQESKSLDYETDLKKKILDFESKLEKKTCFINELKGELLKTCNSLIAKESELDDLKSKLSEYKAKSNSVSVGNGEIPENFDASIRQLTNHKWDLIQTILRMQKEFYDERGIHMKFFDKFKQRIDSLYFLHLPHSLTRSKSLPTVGTVPQNLLCDEKSQSLRSLISLELDIECLENMKIFLKRFVFPHLFSNIQDPKTVVPDQTEEIAKVKRKLFSSDQKHSTASLEKLIGSNSHESFVSLFNLSEANVTNGNISDTESYAICFYHHIAAIEKALCSVGSVHEVFKTSDFSDEESPEQRIKFLVWEMMKETERLKTEFNKLFKFNSMLKGMCHFSQYNLLKQDTCDRESLLSEEIAISRSESPLSSDAPASSRLNASKRTGENFSSKSLCKPGCLKEVALASSCDSMCPRSHYSSPDLGIESDPNQENSAPELKDKSTRQLHSSLESKESKIIPKTVFTSKEHNNSTGFRLSDSNLYSIGNLSDYELLKREIQESLIGMKSVIMRTGDGLHHVAKVTSPRKTLEYDTLKAIKNTCNNIEVCLQQAYKLVGKFWISICPTETEWNSLIEENQRINNQLLTLKEINWTQEKEFKHAMEKLKRAQDQKAKIEKKISKKLVKTKVVLRQAETKLIENQCQNFPTLPKYLNEQTCPKEIHT